MLHDSFGFAFPTIASVLDTTPVAARKLASRARAKVTQPEGTGRPADWEVVDAFLAAAREGDFARLLQLLAPDAVVAGDESAVLVGTPTRIDGRQEVATFVDGVVRRIDFRADPQVLAQVHRRDGAKKRTYGHDPGHTRGPVDVIQTGPHDGHRIP